MRPSSRTPEGEPNRCPLCGRAVRLEPSSPPGDAPCPFCGQLLWFPRRPAPVRRTTGAAHFVAAVTPIAVITAASVLRGWLSAAEWTILAVLAALLFGRQLPRAVRTVCHRFV